MNDLSGLVVFKNAESWGPGVAASEHDGGLHDSLDYLRNREQAERAAAKRAQSLAARHAHQELAQYYAELVRRAR